MSEFLRDFKRVSQVIFDGDITTLSFKIRMWLVERLLPKDLLLFFAMVICKLRIEYDTLDQDKINKITSLKIEFEYKE